MSIIAQARASALGQAWRLFREAGLDEVTDDPAVLSVHGRLLKDEARAATGTQQQRFYREAAECYARAAKLGGQTYPLINAATLSLLAGQSRKAQALAREVLQRGPDEAETSYWRGATEAEALLLLGKNAEARRALSNALAQAPQAYEDHASTLRQFALILDCRDEDKSWLDPFRPPGCVHFAGAMTLARGEEKSLGEQVRTILQKERVGAGYGALAAGADILIAEALLEAKAELHLVLPSPLPRFREASVGRYGARWRARFDRLVKAAASLRALPESPRTPFSLAIRLAAEIGMGLTVMQAETLQTEAIQIVVLAKNATVTRDPSSSAWTAAHWRKSGRREHVLRTESAAARVERPARTKGRQVSLAATLHIALESGDPDVTEKRLQALAVRLPMPSRLIPPRWTGEAVILAYRTAAAAADAAAAVLRIPGMASEACISAHYGIAHRLMDPFSRTSYLAGGGAELAAGILSSTPIGAFYASEDFAAALHAAGDGRRTEYVGDLPAEEPRQATRLYAIRR